MPKRSGSPLESGKKTKITKFFTTKPPRPKKTSEKDAASTSTVVPTSTKEEASNDEPLEDLPSEPLEQLLSFEGLETHEAIDARFEVIARTLFAKYLLRVERPGESKKEVASDIDKLPAESVDSEVKEELKDVANQANYTDLQILEMEFYLISPGVHEDPFCHGSVEQKGSGWWYFHRAPQRSASSTITPSAGGAYRSGSRKGMDLTFGTAIQGGGGTTDAAKDKSGSGSVAAVGKPRGGILLRTARVVKTGVVVSGPSLLVDLILSLSGADAIETLVQDHWQGDISAFHSPEDPYDSSKRGSRLSLILNPSASPSKLKCYRSPRIGLDLSHYTAAADVTNPRVIFVQKHYRFVRDPHLLKANGRSQLFVGLLLHSIRELYPNGVKFPLSSKEKGAIANSIATLGGWPILSTRNYIGHFEAGVSSGFKLVGPYCGPSGKGACGTVEKIILLFGALYSTQQSGRS